MRIDGYQCDVCTKIEPVTSDSFRSHGIAPPSSWFALGVDPNQDSLHFCSLTCLRDWIEKKLDVQEVAS